MTQTDAFRPQQWRYVGPVAEQGACSATNPQKYQDEAGLLHYGKEHKDVHPFIVANEIVAARLAQLMEIPAPDVFATRIRGKTWVMATEVPGQSYPPFDPYTIANSAVSKADIARILCLDLLTMNRDRHWGNLIYMAAERLAAIDHDRALFGWQGRDRPLSVEHGCGGECTTHSEATVQFVTLFGLSESDLEAGIASIEGLSDEDIAQVTGDLPPWVLSSSRLIELREVLTSRVRGIRLLVSEFIGRADLSFATVSATRP